MQADVEEGEIVEEAEFVERPSWKNAVRDARRKMVQFAEQAHVAGIEQGQAERKAREFEGDVKRTEEELHMLQRKLVRVARQREAVHHHARHMFMAAAHVVPKPDDGARQDALAACAQALRHMRFDHQNRSRFLTPEVDFETAISMKT